MAIIEPFKGIRYNPERVPDISNVVAPPYDVISPQQREWYHKRDPHNIVRVTLPKAPPQVAHADRYDLAARYLETWMEDHIMIEDGEPAIYLADSEFVHDGKVHHRKSFIAAVKMEEPGKGQIYPHEETLPGPKADRLALLTATRTDLGPLFSLYPDDGTILSILDTAPVGDPLCTAIDRDDVQTSLRAITDPETIQKLKTEFASRPLLIADGHHRYETALKYRGPKETGTPADYVMMACTSYLDPGLLVLPTHRVVKANGIFNLEDFLNKASRHFEITRLRRSDSHPADVLINAISKANSHAYGIYAGYGEMAVLNLLHEEIIEKNPAPHSADWKQLETAVLHWSILHEVMGIDGDNDKSGHHVDYVRDATEAIELVEERKFDLALLLKPTRISQTRRVAELNERMPAKSTLFSPKLPSGLVLRAL